MRFTAFKIIVILLVGIASIAADQRGGKGRSRGGVGAGGGGGTTTTSGPNDFYTSLCDDAEVIKCVDYRSNTSIDANDDGSGRNPYVSYEATEDAAVIRIPAFQGATYTIVGAIDSSQTTMVITPNLSGDPGVSLLCGTEIILVGNWTNNTPSANQSTLNPITRGHNSSTAASHADASTCLRSGNSLGQSLLTSLGENTTDGNTYLYIWDEQTTSSYLNNNFGYKQSHLWTSSSGGVHLENRWLLNGSGDSGYSASCFSAGTHTHAIDLRFYGVVYDGNPTWASGNATRAGPNVGPFGGNAGIYPIANDYCARPGKWVRRWVRVGQYASDWDPYSTWAWAEDEMSPTLVYDDLQVSVFTQTASHFGVAEANTSTASYQLSPGRQSNDLVSCVRNVIILKSSGNIAASAFNDTAMTNTYLQKPIAAGTCS